MSSDLVAAGMRRARHAKVLAAAGGIAVFAVSLGLARSSHASHHKQRAQALSAPPEFVGIVQDDILRSGIIGPAQAPPEAQTSES